ncbi:hypothetical protein [Kribbella deserti]|uniref:Uncharacterized protein n=1 Tax=Kribbella deserti TaxID=1926257 RepID=A0ABV6QMF0_9ACTN
MRRLIKLAAAVAALGMLTTPTAYAATEPVDVVHTEITQVGPYKLKTSFSQWPLRAEKSLDFLFEPEGGIQGLKAEVRPISPKGSVLLAQAQSTPDGTKLARHPRALDKWGFDIVALTSPGTWRFEYEIDGPKGRGTGVLEIPVGNRPGPPAALAWSLGLLPLAAVIPLGSLLWLRTRTGRRREAWTWR